MNNKRSATIGRKLGLGFLIITLLILIIGAVSTFTIDKLTTLTEQLYNHPYTVSNAIRNILNDTIRIELELNNLINASEDTSKGELSNHKEFDTQVSISTIDHCEHNIEKEFEIIFDRYLGNKQDIKIAYDIFKKWKPIRDRIIYLLQIGDIKEAKWIMKSQGISHNEKIYDSMNEMMTFAAKKGESFYQNLLIEKESSIILIVTIVILSFFASILTSFIMTKDIRIPLEQLLHITQRVSKGDMKITATKEGQDLHNRSDEIGTLYRSFETIISFLILPYQAIIKSDRNLIEKTDEIRRLLNSFNEHVIASKTDCHGRIIYVSNAFSKISGFSKDEMIGSMQNIVRHPDTSKELYKELWKTIQSGKVWTGEIKNKTKDGGFFWIYMHISPDIDSNGKIIGYNAINQDITAQKELEKLSHTLEDRIREEISKNKQQASHMLQQSRLAQMGEMISMIAHQWRQPLASISAISGTLSIDVQLDDYQKEFFEERLEAISELVLHLSSTINDFRNFFKEDKEEEEETTTEKIIDSCLQIIMPSLTTNNIIIENQNEEDIPFKTYPNEIKQVLLNLLKNSEEAILEKGIEKGTIEIHSYTQDNTVHICVEDNAGGIPLEIIEKIFDPYFSTKTKKDGTGLGLYMSKTIINEHCKGHLEVRNTEKGALFEIILPLKIEVIQ